MPFELEEREDKFSLIHCASLTVSQADEFLQVLKEQVARLAQLPQLRVIVDLKGTADLPPEILPGLAKLGERVTSLQKKLYFVNVPPRTEEMIKKSSVSSFIHLLYNSPVEKMTSGQALPVHSEAVLLNGLREGVLWTLHMLCPSFPVTAGEPYINPSRDKVGDYLAAQLHFQSRTHDGTIAISFPESVYLKLMSAMHDANYQSLAEAPEDGICELLNMVRSITRKSLHDKGYVLSQEIPSLIKGDLIEKLLGKFENHLVIPFDASHGTFHCQIGFSVRK